MASESAVKSIGIRECPEMLDCPWEIAMRVQEFQGDNGEISIFEKKLSTNLFLILLFFITPLLA